MTVNVLSLLEAEGAEDILIQVVKLSEDSLKLPEQVVLSVLVVIVLVDIDSLNVTATVVETATLVELSSGLTESTVGAVVSEELEEELSVEVDVLSVSELPLMLSSVLAQLLRVNTRSKIIGKRNCNNFYCIYIYGYPSLDKFTRQLVCESFVNCISFFLYRCYIYCLPD